MNEERTVRVFLSLSGYPILWQLFDSPNEIRCPVSLISLLSCKYHATTVWFCAVLFVYSIPYLVCGSSTRSASLLIIRRFFSLHLLNNMLILSFSYLRFDGRIVLPTPTRKQTTSNRRLSTVRCYFCCCFLRISLINWHLITLLNINWDAKMMYSRVPDIWLSATSCFIEMTG